MRVVEGDDEFFSANGEMAAGFDEFAVKLFGFHAFAALESLREPSVTAVGEHGQDDIGVDVQTHFAGEAIEIPAFFLFPARRPLSPHLARPRSTPPTPQIRAYLPTRKSAFLARERAARHRNSSTKKSKTAEALCGSHAVRSLLAKRIFPISS